MAITNANANTYAITNKTADTSTVTGTVATTMDFSKLILRLVKQNLVAKLEFNLVEKRTQLNVFTKDGFFLTSYTKTTMPARGVLAEKN